ncbi:MAG: family 78 glycoside hydrolase catalytic domain [Clostridia bacterium]|nr:family 78 glycoside hydrolase catalytic domain [Clostridia bacterium]
MGVFEKSKFIWYEEEAKIDSYGEFLPTLEYCGGECIFRISCDGDYTLFINGNYVSSNQYGDYEHYKSYDEIDISSYLTKGENQMTILVWHFGKDSQRYKHYKAGVIFEALVDGKLALVSNSHTPSRKSKAYTSGKQRLISSQLGFTYECNCRDEIPEKPHTCVEIDKKCNFVPRPNKRLCLGDFVPATEIYNKGGRKIVLDLGKEYVGLLSFEIEVDKQCYVNIAYGEHLKNGLVPRRIHDRDFSVDLLAKKGTNTHTNYMLRLACRYLEITSFYPVVVKKIGLIPQYYKATRKEVDIESTLDCEIYDICMNTLELSMMEHYVDCPWREQCLYAYDSRNQMLSGYYGFEGGNFDYARSNLLLMSKDNRPDGLLSICFPCGIDLVIPSFCLYYVIAVWEYLSHTGDKSLIYEVIDKLKEIIKVFLNNKKGDLVSILEGNDYWNFYDWSKGADGGCSYEDQIDPLINLIFILALRAYDNICKYCSLENEFYFDEKEFLAKAKERFFNESLGLWEMNGIASELVNSLAILSGASQSKEAKEICKKLSENQLESCSLSMKCFKYDALLKIDPQYKDTILEEIRKTYTPMLKTGTAWETAKGYEDFDGAGSLCHGWSAIPVYYYHKLGIVKR